MTSLTAMALLATSSSGKSTHDLLELTQVTGLESPDLLVTGAPEEVVTQGLVRATRRPCDLHVARDHSCPGDRCQTNGQLLQDPLELKIDIRALGVGGGWPSRLYAWPSRLYGGGPCDYCVSPSPNNWLLGFFRLGLNLGS